MSNLAISTLNEATKKDLESLANVVVSSVAEGQENPVKVIAQLKKYEKLIELISKNPAFKDALINELSRSVWCELTAKVKEREAFLKGLPYEGMTVVDEVSGEVTKVYPPAKKSSDVIKAIYK